MRIARIKIHNYRSIRELEIECQPLMVFLGPNNHGKSNVLAALEFFLTPGGKVEKSDMFDFSTRDDDLIWVEVTFQELTEQEKTTFKKYVMSDGSVRVRKTATFDKDKAELKYQGWLEEPQEEWLKAEKAADFKKLSDVESTGLYDLLKDDGRLSKAKVEEAQQKYIAKHRDELKFNLALESTNFLGQKSVAAGVLPELHLIPAVRDLSDEMKIKNTALLGRLVNRAIQIMSEKDPAFLEIQTQLKAQIARLNEKDEHNQPKIEQIREIKTELETELKAWGVTIDLEIDTPPIDKIFELGTNLHLDDGIRTLAEKKGHGLQRALIFALFKTWARLVRRQFETSGDGDPKPRASSNSIYFAIEEPELFLHPQAQSELAASLAILAENDGDQVFVCTHSSHFVDIEKYRSICLISKPDPSQGTIVRQCKTDIFTGVDSKAKKDRLKMAYWINPDRGEMFFARKVVFVEGETEKTVIPYLARKMSVFDSEVSIIDCGSKNNIPLYMTIANAFALDYVVVHDEDPLPASIPSDWGKEKRQAKENTFALNEIINTTRNGSIGYVEIMRPDFENESGIPKSQGEKLGKPLAALEHFEGKKVEDLPSQIQQRIKNIYGSRSQS